jgi:lipoyl(octanoyl) transferase
VSAALPKSVTGNESVTHIPNECWVVDLGPIAYDPACEWQHRVVAARKAGAVPDVLLLCEHPHVITLGRNGRNENLLASSNVLRQMNVEFHATDRGGDITYHGPGQIVGYPILDLTAHRRDVRWYVSQLEEAMIRATREYGVESRRIEGMHGIWVDAPASAGGAEKLAALGVHLSRWVTSHGFAYNVTTDLRYFDLIVPCGIADKRATSLERILGRAVDFIEAKKRITRHFGEVFDRALVRISRDELDAFLRAPGALGLQEVSPQVAVSADAPQHM